MILPTSDLRIAISFRRISFESAEFGVPLKIGSQSVWPIKLWCHPGWCISANLEGLIDDLHIWVYYAYLGTCRWMFQHGTFWFHSRGRVRLLSFYTLLHGSRFVVDIHSCSDGTPKKFTQFQFTCRELVSKWSWSKRYYAVKCVSGVGNMDAKYVWGIMTLRTASASLK